MKLSDWGKTGVAAVLMVALVGCANTGSPKDVAATHEHGDYAKELSHWRPLAEQGDAKAQYNISQMYYKGQGLPQNYAEAVRWYRKAAEQGVARAQYNISQMYYN